MRKFWPFFVDYKKKFVMYFIFVTERFGAQIAPGATIGYLGDKWLPIVKRGPIFRSKVNFQTSILTRPI
jgi:hypothetical protein